MPVSVGIDLGTTFSAVATIDEKTNKPVIVLNDEGKKITPSIIYFNNGNIVFGSEAADAFAEGNIDCAASFKRSMGTDNICFVKNDVFYKAEDLSALLLKHLKESAEKTLGDTIKDVVITVPAYFYSIEREATLKAAEKAGLKVKKIIDEPNAAALAYGVNNWRENANILVYDLGGGTFDVTLIRMVGEGNLKAISTKGDHRLGGKDWDDRLCDILKRKIIEETGIADDCLQQLNPTIRGMAEEIKKQLSLLQSVKVNIFVPDFGNLTVEISRDEFYRETLDLIERTGLLCDEVLREAKIRINDVADILLVGGSTRMPQVSDYIENKFRKQPIKHVNPDEAVALGAAIQATKDEEKYVALSVENANGKKVTKRNDSLLRVRNVKEKKNIGDLGILTLSETTAHAMGVVAIDSDKNKYYNEIIIPANHTRPVRAAKRFRFFTYPDSKNELEIYVLQGDKESPVDCEFTHKYVVSGIQHFTNGDTIGTVIRVQYSYDKNGIIRVQARQENEEVDLPIKKESTNSDISKFSGAVNNEKTKSGKSVGIMLNNKYQNNIAHKYKAITFSNVEWKKYDKINDHPAACAPEPKIHVIANKKNIEFHGYTVSEMDEGVTYTIGASDSFEIECNIDTSSIQPHPGGHLEISLGIISANLNENGGSIFLDGECIADVGSKFNLKMSITNGGKYEIYINKKLAGEKIKPMHGYIEVLFGFKHDSHCCSLLSHAYVSEINMRQRSGAGTQNQGSETPTWDD